MLTSVTAPLTLLIENLPRSLPLRMLNPTVLYALVRSASVALTLPKTTVPAVVFS